MSNREFIDAYIRKNYSTTPDYPWMSQPTYAVYRHKTNRKWFAVIMDIPKSRLGLEGEAAVSVVNLKSDPLMIGSLQLEKGIYPAYHMNKNHWITILLDGSVEEDKLKWLLDISFGLSGSR